MIEIFILFNPNQAAEKKYPTEPRLEPYPPNRTPDGQFLVRVLIPRNSEGVMIGKGGMVVRQMTNETGCNFQLGTEQDTYHTFERIFSLTSTNVLSIVQGANAVLTTLLSQPKVRTYANPGTAYGVPSNNMIAPAHLQQQQPHIPYNGGSAQYLPAAPAMGMNPGMMMAAPAPGMMYPGAPPQQQPMQYVPQMSAPMPVQGAPLSLQQNGYAPSGYVPVAGYAPQAGGYVQAVAPILQQYHQQQQPFFQDHPAYQQGQTHQSQYNRPLQSNPGAYGGAGGNAGAAPIGGGGQAQGQGGNKVNNKQGGHAGGPSQQKQHLMQNVPVVSLDC